MPAFRKNSLQRVPRSGPRRSRPGAARSVHPAREGSPSLPSARLYVEIAEAGNGANFGVHEGRVLGCGFLELDEGLREIVFEILGVGRIVEAVDVPIFVQSSDGEGPAGNNCRARLLNAARADALAYKCRSRGRQSRHCLFRIRWARTSQAPRG